jgi:hypothetical protein
VRLFSFRCVIVYVQCFSITTSRDIGAAIYRTYKGIVVLSITTVLGIGLVYRWCYLLAYWVGHMEFSDSDCFVFR